MDRTERKESRRFLLGALATAPLTLAALGTGVQTKAATGSPAQANMETRLAALEAAQALDEAHRQIKRVLNLYARGWDRRDEEALRACFWPDSTHEHGNYKGTSDAFITGGMTATRSVKRMSHIITNETIDVVDDRAISECYFVAHHLRPRTDGNAGDEDMFVKGRYLDRFERRNGEWKIVHRRGLSDYSTIQRPASTLLDGTPSGQLSGDKPGDPLYSLLASLTN